MNLLQHKDILRGLLKQGDVLNTINGGGAMTYVEEQVYDDHFVLTFWAPSVPAEAFNIVLNDNTLVVYSVLPSTLQEDDTRVFSIPMFFRRFSLPAYADGENIEAVHENDRLSIIIPFRKNGIPVKKINIKKDFNSR